MSTLKVDTVKPITSSGDLSLQGDSSGSAVDCLNIDSSGDINFSGNTAAKIKLPSAGGIYESDGSTAILTESGGSVTLDVSGGTLTSSTTQKTAILAGGTYPNGHIVYVQKTAIPGVGTGNASTGWQTTDIPTITIPSAKVALGSKIFISAICGFAMADGTSHTRMDWKLHRTAPSDSTLVYANYIGDYGNTDTQQISFTISPITIDESLGSGDHTYRISYRKAGGSGSAEAAYIYPAWADSSAVYNYLAMVIV